MRFGRERERHGVEPVAIVLADEAEAAVGEQVGGGVLERHKLVGGEWLGCPAHVRGDPYARVTVLGGPVDLVRQHRDHLRCARTSAVQQRRMDGCDGELPTSDRRAVAYGALGERPREVVRWDRIGPAHDAMTGAQPGAYE